MAHLLFAFCLLAHEPPPKATAPAVAEPAGQRAELGGLGATLFVPEGYQPRGGKFIDVLLHLHGAMTVIEPAVVGSRMNFVLVAFNRKGLSSVYKQPFSDPALFGKLLDATLGEARRLKLAEDLRLGKVVVSSFSAGFGGVREILKVPEHFARVDGLVMADSIYCGYAGEPSRHVVDPASMEGFRKFAEEAAAGRKTFLLTHSEQVPEGYASTTETADFLIKAVEKSSGEKKSAGTLALPTTRAWRWGKFVVLGLPGAGPEDHMRHLRRIEDLWKNYEAIQPEGG